MQQPQQKMLARDDLVRSAANLQRSAPDQWRLFLEALAVFTEVHRDNLVKSPLPELPVNQGKALMMSLFLDMMKNCSAEAEKIGKK